MASGTTGRGFTVWKWHHQSGPTNGHVTRFTGIAAGYMVTGFASKAKIIMASALATGLSNHRIVIKRPGYNLNAIRQCAFAKTIDGG